MKINKSHFTFDRGQRNGILFLLGVILLVVGLKIYFRSKTKAQEFKLSSAEVDLLREEMDSLKRIKADQSARPNYKFNPNFISEYKAYTLGLSAKEYLKLKSYRDEGKWINSVTDFKKVTGVSDSLLKVISADFKFPDWVNNRKTFSNSKPKSFSALPTHLKKDLNTATAEELRQVPGIGAVLSERIISYREKLGGFSVNEQLFAVYGLSDEVIDRIGMRFSVKGVKEMERYNINTASASDIATLPGISFELAREIWSFVRVREGIKDLDELTKIEEITPAKLRLIKLYLSTE
ncbi:helix-hairpin-helix domain-containing protein [Aureitalea sp. L0-47]|uniref:ComEA family DNA-binding protein n=1 Tax=Aureitalea sp. L0-47 TaxID=2816962 RepID=UPI00223783D6|nr:helix-hairpin-helix domain-containing protein [Aureitalea sp. L0-47]MCW5520674.1 helix-hairpin-helix domain-containing protein [Aureitalea sp. L0-47]